MSNTGTLLSPVRPPAPYPSTPRAERGRAVIRLWLPLTPLWLILAPFALLVSPALTLAPATRRMSPFRAAWRWGGCCSPCPEPRSRSTARPRSSASTSSEETRP